MITKIIFTMLVIVIVGMIFNTKNASKAEAKKAESSAQSVHAKTASLAPKSLAYLLIALLIMVSAVLYYFSWSDANQLVKMRVFNANGELSEYQAYRKDIEGRVITSIDGVRIELADTDRVEMIIQK